MVAAHGMRFGADGRWRVAARLVVVSYIMCGLDGLGYNRQGVYNVIGFMSQLSANS